MKKIISFVLVLSMALCCLSIGPVSTANAAIAPTLTVDMTAKTGPMRHGSAGFLYGLGSHGTPNVNTLTPLKPGTAVQKAPDGLQHPTGDVLDVAETFMEAGGEQVQIYLQDIFALWDYEYTGMEDYLARIREMVPKIKELRESDPMFTGKIVYIPFNEPDGIWYGDIGSDTGRFNADWKAAYDLIKELDPDALIGGISTRYYIADVFDSWLGFCKENDCQPDYVTWHELQNDKLSVFADDLAHYRSLEEKYSMEPREVIVNEYAPQDHCSVPGKLVNWIALFEENKASGCLPYWHNAGNLNDIAADNNEPNGAWWLYKWYGDMSGETLKLTTSTNRDQLYGLASIDDNKKSANVIFGGVDGTADIVLENIAETDAFSGAEAVNVKIEATYWTAFHGVAAEPAVIRVGTYAVEDGKVTVELDAMEAYAAYNITVTAANEDDKPGAVFRGPWRKTWEAEDATLVGGAYSNSDPWTYAYSGGARVSGIDAVTSGVDFTVDVPQTGYYRADMVYGNGLGLNTADPSENNPVSVIQTRTIDGESESLVLENTLRWQMAGMYTDYIRLDAGEHSISYRGVGGQGASIDCLSLTYVGGEIPEFDSVYEAELGDFNTLLDNETTSVTTESALPGYSASGYITGLDKTSVEQGGGVRFTVVVPDNGLYNLTLRYEAEADASAGLYLDNTALTLNNRLTEVELPASEGFASASVAVFLQKGINIIDIDSDKAIALDYLRVRAADAEAAAAVEAEDGTIDGDAKAADNDYASGGSYVPGLKAAQGYDNISGEFTVVGLNSDLLSYESSADALLIYADYDSKNQLTAVKSAALPAGEAVAELDPGHDKTFIWYAIDNARPAVKLLDQARAESLTVNVNVPEAGDYKLVIRYSNNELFGAHSYNAQIVDRYASYSVNGGEGQRIYFKNTYSNENWRTVAVPVQLSAGDNTIAFRNDNWRLVRCGVLKSGTSEHLPENIDYQTLVNYTPNLDSFLIYPAVTEAGAAQERFKVNVMSTDGGTVSIDKASVAPGESVTLRIVPQILGGSYIVTANGVDVTSMAEDGVLTVAVEENTDFRVRFIPSENSDDYIVNNSFGTGDTSGWDASNVTVGEFDGVHKAVFSQGGSLSQTVALPDTGFYTLSYKAEGAGSLTFGDVTRDIAASGTVTALAANGEITLSISGDDLTVDDFLITGYMPVDTELVYFVDCGDRDVTTLSEDDRLGVNNSVTEQFYGEDQVTGKWWGIDDTYTPSAAYPGLLTGQYTWPHEHQGTDGESKMISMRYAKDQDDRTGPGVTYKFELEDGLYDFEFGLRAPSNWLSNGDNRKSSIRVNDTVVAAGLLPTYDGIVVRAQAETEGGSAVVNLRLDSDGKGGPMISYIKISHAAGKLIDTSGMTKTDAGTWNNDQNTKADKAFDGDYDTFFDGIPGSYAQIDFGEEKNIIAIGYVPRSAYPDRMNNTSFWVSKDGSQWIELYRITDIPAVGSETIVKARDFLTQETGWRYLKYQNDNDYCNIAEIRVYEE